LIHISFNFLVSVRDIYYRYFLDGNSSSEPFPSPVIVIVGGLILISLSLIWIVPFLKKHWKSTIKKGHPLLSEW
ncbi:hypothetical protein VKA52_17270, partial [Halobacillus sp. HZG1]|uniref:hypothetical protein n=1 Tax=Halobacillus sp. HZG1 TaxID=3111769 RepID=UPI002DB58227